MKNKGKKKLRKKQGTIKRPEEDMDMIVNSFSMQVKAITGRSQMSVMACSDSTMLLKANERQNKKVHAVEERKAHAVEWKTGRSTQEALSLSRLSSPNACLSEALSQLSPLSSVLWMGERGGSEMESQHAREGERGAPLPPR